MRKPFEGTLSCPSIGKPAEIGSKAALPSDASLWPWPISRFIEGCWLCAQQPLWDVLQISSTFALCFNAYFLRIFLGVAGIQAHQDRARQMTNY